MTTPRKRLEATLTMADRYGVGGCQFAEGPEGFVSFDDVRALLSEREVGREALKDALQASRGWPAFLHPGPAADAILSLLGGE